MGTREKIIKSAVALFIEQGVASTTTRAIAANASIAEGSIYRYFKSKDEMAWQIFHEYHQYLAERLQESIKECNSTKVKITSLVNSFLTLADEDWLMFRYYLTSQHTHMHKINKKMLTPYKVILSVIEGGVSSNEIDDEKVKIIAAMAMGAVHQLATNKIFDRIEGDLSLHKEFVAKKIYKLVLR